MSSAVLFDLDGTLVDSAPGIVAGVNATLGTRLTVEEMRPNIGPPLHDTFARLGVDDVDATVEEYRARYATLMLDGTVVFDGIEALLARLRDDGRRLAVATSKAKTLAVPLLEHLGLAGYFDAIEGPVPPGMDSKAVTVRAALDALGTDDAVMVGDRVHDVEGAHAHGLQAVGVLWGFGDAAELAGADALVATPVELADALSPRS